MPKLIDRNALLRSACGVVVLALCSPPRWAAQEAANPHAQTLVEFQKRVKAYSDLRGKVETGPAQQKETSDPAKIVEAQQTLAARIRAARKDAQPGDLFTPAIQERFKRLLAPQLKGKEGQNTKADIKEDAPKAIQLKVNAAYPEAQPLPTVPPNILANLPKLPEDLEYRIVDRHLILRDVAANLIVDFIPNAIR